jgi:hypothetical protein
MEKLGGTLKLHFKTPRVVLLSEGDKVGEFAMAGKEGKSRFKACKTNLEGFLSDDKFPTPLDSA